MNPFVMTLLVVMSSAPSIGDPDPRIRMKAVEQRKEKGDRFNGLSSEGRNSLSMAQCVRAAAPPEAGCARQVWLCQTTQSAATNWGGAWRGDFLQVLSPRVEPTDTNIAKHGLIESEKQPILRFVASYDWFVRCRLNASEQPRVPSTGPGAECDRDPALGREVVVTDLRCDVLLVNPCFHEMYVICRETGGRVPPSLSPMIPALDVVFRVSWPEVPPLPAR
jgi:hypothetical protein